MKPIRSKLIFLLFSILLLVSCGKGCQKTVGLKGEAEPFNFIPPQNNFLISINWKRFITTPFFADLSKEMPLEVKEISSDVDQMLIALNIQDPLTPTSGLIIFSGHLDEKKIVSVLEEDAKREGKEVKKETFENRTIYLSPKDPNIGFTLLSSSFAVAGQLVPLKAALTLITKGGESLNSNKELVDLFSHRDTNKLLWGGATLTTTPNPSLSVPAQAANPITTNLQGLKTISFNLDYTKELLFNFVGTAQETAPIQNLTNLFNSYKTIFGASLASKDPALAQTIQQMEIVNEDKTIRVNLKLPEEIVQKLSKKLKEKKEN